MSYLLKISIICFLFSDYNYAQQPASFSQLVYHLNNQRLSLLEQSTEIKRFLDKKHVLTGADLLFIKSQSRSIQETGTTALDFIDQSVDKTLLKKKNRYKIAEKEFKNITLSLALAAMMRDTYLYLYKDFYLNKKLRRLINEQDQAFDDSSKTFKIANRNYSSLSKRKYFKRAVQVYREKNVEYQYLFDNDTELKLARELINSSPTVQDIIERNFWKNIGNAFKTTALGFRNLTIHLNDFMGKLGSNLITGGSKIFGNFSGMFQSRRGKLYRNQEFIQDITQTLQPLDILFEKTPFRTTDNFIPGYWGHVAIYIGNREQLEELELWEHPVVKPFQAHILSGKTIVEALRTGVEINSFQHFSDIDDFAHVRLRVPYNRSETRRHILTALRQVGKKYDFSFNVELNNKLVCSELLYVTFSRIEFETTPILGRRTINVDQVAKQVINDGPFEALRLFINGLEVDLPQLRFEEILTSQ